MGYRVESQDVIVPPPGPVRRRDAERTRNALMKAAFKEFSQHGFAGTRMDRVAKAAKCNIRMVYHYFGDKKGLYVAVLEAAYADLRQKEAGLKIDVDRPLEGMLELMRFTFLYFQNNPMFEGLLRAENMVHGRFVQRSRPVPEAGSALKRLLSALIASGQAQALFRDDLGPGEPLRHHDGAEPLPPGQRLFPVGGAGDGPAGQGVASPAAGLLPGAAQGPPAEAAVTPAVAAAPGALWRAIRAGRSMVVSRPSRTTTRPLTTV